ncbi:MAG: hypothetical protein JSW23_09175 [Planctomycetota bacterium]|nr:MAG: hypothetical protein JSW23_09175 [Planctomycetota bacterium]
MSLREKAKHIGVELRGHLPFTLFGALLGIFFMLVFKNVSGASGRMLFSVFHPGHVILSAMVTASMFGLHAERKRFVLVLLVGYFGSIGVATLSDVVIPHIGTGLLGLDVPGHGELHRHESSNVSEDEHHEHVQGVESEHHERRIHLGFIEEWYIVNPAALLGVLIAYFLPRTKFPHAAHILISTWASSSYLLMNLNSTITAAAAIGIFVTLFIAIWIPCCISDIVFPLLFVKSDVELAGVCPVHGRHSHPHVHAESEDTDGNGT